MKIKLILALLICLSLIAENSHAQQGDPWIHQAYKELYNRTPTAAELNIQNYNRGTWGNYAELKSHVARYQSSLKGPALTGDPWIFQAYKELYNRTPNALEVNIKNYNGGTWASYADLKKYVQQFQSAMSQAGMTVSTAHINNIALVGIKENGQQVAVAALSLKGGEIISNDGASIISGGAGNLIGLDGAGVVVNSAMGGISFGSSYTLASENTRVIKSGKGSLIISKK